MKFDEAKGFIKELKGLINLDRELINELIKQRASDDVRLTITIQRLFELEYGLKSLASWSVTNE